MISPEAAVAIGIGLAASIEDLIRRQISNWIPVAAFVGGMVCQTIAHGWWGLLYSLGGTVCGFAVFLIFYLLGGMGGGDVKLMAGFGALLGTKRLLAAALWTAGVGGLLALAVIAFGTIRRWLRPATDQSAAESDSIPYAPAIALGVWLAMVPK